MSKKSGKKTAVANISAKANDNKSGYYAFKKRVFDIIQIGNKSDFVSRFFDVFIATVIIINIVVMFLETFQELQAYFDLFYWLG